MRTPLPTLDSPQGKIPSRSDYSAPDGYFEKLPQRVTARIEGELANNHDCILLLCWALGGRGFRSSDRWPGLVGDS